MEAVFLSNQNLTLSDAKAKFVSSFVEIDPVKIIQDKPIKALGIALATGLFLGFSGKRTSKAFFPGPQMVVSLLKKLF